MERLETEEETEFPVAGFRARRWLRFERDLQAWLESPDGEFARWQAMRAVTAGSTGA
jgi:hypothetical protein